MKKKYAFIGTGVIFIILLGSCLSSSKTMFSGKDVPFPESVGSQPAACNVKEIKLLMKGTHPKWSDKRNLVVFDKMTNGIYEIFTMDPDGSNVTCLTCRKQEAPTGHKGQAFWHPSGEYIVFAAENENGKHLGSNTPGLGRDNDVWVMTADGSRFWRITNYPEKWGVIRPSFSHDGTKLYWNEEYSCERGKTKCSFWNHWNLFFRKGEEFGLFRTVIADISFDSGEPTVSNIKKVTYGNLRMLEGSGFTPDDQHVIFSASDLRLTGGRMLWGDVYIGDLEGSILTKLTDTPFLKNENEEYSPDGKRIVWTLGPYIGWGRFYAHELYLMDADGKNKTRLTHFNTPEDKQHLVGESSWSPDGRQVIFHKYDESAQEFSAASLYMLTFEGPCGAL